METARTGGKVERDRSPGILGGSGIVGGGGGGGGSAATSTTTTSTSLSTRVKYEPSSSSDEMKEFAETAMNELLGWYGYEGGPDTSHRTRTRSGGDSSGPEFSDSGGGSASSGGRARNGGEVAPGGNTGGWWCGWCSRPMSEGGAATGAFCSELCFSQSRRASFKKNRMCDWCRHVRHSVAHVDVHDGQRHLQFCSDKCLNQYKMHIFCRETQAYFELRRLGCPSATQAPRAAPDSPLITPDLWLRDCRELTPPPAAPPPPPPPPMSAVEATPRRRRPGSAARRTSKPVETPPEAPQDLRVRPSRSPTPPPPATQWPPPPPPLTVLVPYPVVVPVPIPLPLPIPIPISDAIFKRMSDSGGTTTPPPPSDQPRVESLRKPVTRILRKRKRVSDSTPVSTPPASKAPSRKSVPA